ncbi:polysaccharide deacetylase family protein [Domibacillus indicus]|uniref:polysaccharide deacetylase family protein n=1 Tax=Domibacillus indicus TaxID=1437523 RepID=UPI0006987093|nr:polysaccharide deacetylase family protein [Domibacillus indicus]
MKKKKAAVALLASVLLLLAMVLVNLIATATPHNKTVWATNLTKSPYENIDVKTREAKEKRYHLAFQYPVFKNDALNKKFEYYVKKKETDFLKEIEKIDEKKLKKQPASLALTFELIPADGGVYSVLFNEKTYLAPEKNVSAAAIFIVDPDEGAAAKPDDLFISPEKAALALHTPVDIKKSSLYLQGNKIVFLNDQEDEAGSLAFHKAAPFLKKEWRDRLAIGPAKTNVAAGKNVKRIALTFDDGPNPKSTEAILATLKKHNVKATFFMLGGRVERYPKLVEKIVQDGHEAGNHSWSHRDFTKLQPNEVKDEIDRTAAAVEAAAGVSPLAVRPPYGAMNDKINEVIGTKPVLWTIDTMDWKSHNPKAICAVVKKEAKDGSIVLMHDIHQTTAEALDELVSSLQRDGYEFVTVSDI